MSPPSAYVINPRVQKSGTDIGRQSAGIAALNENTKVWKRTFLGLLFYHEDGSQIFHRNLDERLQDILWYLCERLAF
jgi:hypothetical protein